MPAWPARGLLPVRVGNKETKMGVMDILQQYAVRPTSTEDDFDEVVRQVPQDVLGDGVAQAFRSQQTPPFPAMVQQLFGHSSPQLRSGLLSHLIRAVGPAVLANIAGGAFKRMAQAKPGAAEPSIAPTDLERITPEQVREIAAEAEKKDPSVLDRVGEVYAQQPQALKILGGAALAIALGQMANQMRR
jgi:hypothetical protein